MECKTAIHIDENGVKIFGDKKKYLTFQKAQNAADNRNRDRNNYIQSVAYKCSECGFYRLQIYVVFS